MILVVNGRGEGKDILWYHAVIACCLASCPKGDSFVQRVRNREGGRGSISVPFVRNSCVVCDVPFLIVYSIDLIFRLDGAKAKVKSFLK